MFVASPADAEVGARSTASRISIRGSRTERNQSLPVHGPATLPAGVQRGWQGIVQEDPDKTFVEGAKLGLPV